MADAQMPGRIVPAENLHVTIRFYGSSSPAEVEQQTAAVAKAAGLVSGFATAAAGLRWMPKRQPHMLWLALEPSPHAERLHELLAPPAADERASAQQRFRPHITLLRGKRAFLPAALEKAAADLGELRFDRVALIRSHLHQAGARYEILSMHQLKQEPGAPA